MADNAARHAAFAYPGFTDGDTAGQLFTATWPPPRSTG